MKQSGRINQIQNFNSFTDLTMQFIQSNIIPCHLDSNTHIETPTKKGKKQTNADFNTADSIGLTDQKSSSLNDIDPQQLFERFHDIIKISEVEEEEDEEDNPQTVYRKLDYESNAKKAIKLDFSPENSSMTKKNKVHNGKCLSNQVKGKQLFEIMPVLSPVKRRNALQNEVQSAQIESKMEFTPTKLTKTNSHCEMAARKESPYRDLVKNI